MFGYVVIEGEGSALAAAHGGRPKQEYFEYFKDI